MKKIVLTGGGTAGHVMPNIALFPYLKDFEIHYIGGNGIEKTLIEPFGFVKYHEIPCVKYRRGLKASNLLIPFKLLKSIRAARLVLNEIQPDIVFTKGGFVSLPVALACKNVPLVTHESDMSLGLTNKLIRRKCKYVCTAFDVTAKGLKNGVYTGALIRRELRLGRRKAVRPTLLIMGGSLGSEAINDCVSECLPALIKRYDVVHITGKGKAAKTDLRGYTPLEFCDSMPQIYADCDLVISRGGANSLFEIAALRKKALIIPLPKGASRGDQVENAKYFEERGLVRVLNQSDMTPKTLLDEVTKLEHFTPDSFDVDGTKKVASLLCDCALRV